MSSQEVKTKVQAVYTKSLTSSTMWSSRSSEVENLVRDLHLYGTDAGADFATTHFDVILKEILDAASTRKKSHQFNFYSFGRAAIKGLADTLQERTGLRVELAKSTITLTWAEDNPGLI